MNFQSRDHLAHSRLSQLPWADTSPRIELDRFTVVVCAFIVGVTLGTVLWAISLREPALSSPSGIEPASRLAANAHQSPIAGETK